MKSPISSGKPIFALLVFLFLGLPSFAERRNPCGELLLEPQIFKMDDVPLKPGMLIAVKRRWTRKAGWLNEHMKVASVSGDNTRFVLRDKIGRELAFKRKGNCARYGAAVPPAARTGPRKIEEKIEETLRGGRLALSEGNFNVLAGALAEKQAQLSSSFGDADKIRKNDVLRGLAEANRLLLQKISLAMPLEISDLKKINALVAGKDGKALSRWAGMMRGTRVTTADRPDKPWDFRVAEAWAEGAVNDAYLAPRKVPSAIRNLLQRMNEVTFTTSLSRILGLFQELVAIHPFCDGNGRAARAILDYLLIKAGYAPSPHVRGLTDEVLYSSEDELFAAFVEAYSLQLPGIAALLRDTGRNL